MPSAVVAAQTHTLDRAELGRRAAESLSCTPRAFLRWAGSKRAILPHIVDVLPKSFRTYYEPFLGSGALFFLLRPNDASLSDTCSALISTFSAVRDRPATVLKYLAQWPSDPDFYYAVRANPSSGHLRRAAEFIYLNRTCWNGLYRVNTSGAFNVPYGRPKTLQPIDFRNVQACARALRRPGVKLTVADFEEPLSRVREDDLIFLDPPYVTGHTNNGFVDYNEVLFSWSDQERLASLATRLASEGAHVIVTNAAHDDVLALYPGFQSRLLSRHSTIASSPTKRGSISEALFWSCHG